VPFDIRLFWNRWARYILVAALAHVLLALLFVDWIRSPRHDTVVLSQPAMVVIQLLPQAVAAPPEPPPPVAATAPPKAAVNSVRAAPSTPAAMPFVAEAERAANAAPARAADVPEMVESESVQSATTSEPVANGIADPSADPVTLWSSAVLAHLAKFKRYPEQARRQSLEDQVHLRILVDRQGQVLLDQIVDSRGFKELDSEARALVKRANPLPAPPLEATDTDLSFVVSFDFLLEKSKGWLW